ncbi:multifunctional methyltransferase subunit TRM112-like protein At1g22270 [Durio zibethinus]|uniref:Multifunctional methyltransferase subunit TRM112-like protein At1g22270 n=1 Tax=Durio zibethinus TaxID=66656 RepID=A0A6P5YJS8_DURZI|nr:multifunctional methyltransferase subunit TRM112-like protein At1g22270 [Durio zibethinus]
MRLLTHNMLSSNIKGVTNGFPLRIEVEKVVEKEVEINHDFLRNIFPKIDWKAFSDASRIMGYVELPEEAPEPSVLESDLEFLRKFHHALLELHLEEGALVCPETGRKFPVNKGIPNMLLHEDEV